MKKLSCLLLPLLLLLGCTTPPRPELRPEDFSTLGDDPAGQSQLLWGTWLIRTEKGDPIDSQGEFTYHSNGTFTSSATMNRKDLPMTIAVDGLWRIDRGVLVALVTQSSRPGIIPVGLLTKDKILLLDKLNFITKTESGETERYRRANPGNLPGSPARRVPRGL